MQLNPEIHLLEDIDRWISWPWGWQFQYKRQASASMRNRALKQDRKKGRNPLSALAPHHSHGQTFLHTWMHTWYHIGWSSKSPQKNWFTMCSHPAGSSKLSFYMASFYDIYRTGISFLSMLSFQMLAPVVALSHFSSSPLIKENGH